MKIRHSRSVRTLHRVLFWIALSTTLAVGQDAAADRTSGDISGSVTLLRAGEQKKDRSSVVVYLQDGPKAPPESAKLVQRVYQKDKQFSPNITVAPLGSSIEFPNEDKIFHNVFSLSKAARFDLGLYKSGESKSITAKKVGVIDLFCNIHPQMLAKIVVVDTQYYAITESDGRFTIPAVPPGTYNLVAWQPRGKELVTQVTVTRGKRSELKLELAESTERERHRRKDGTPYGRYE
jgi:plastocyanin